MRIALTLLIVLHGLVHLWYFTLAQQLVKFEPEMGWSGRSWLFTDLLGASTTRTLASILFVLLTLAFVVSGITYAARVDGWRPVLLGSAIASSVVLLLFWDGSTEYLVQKGLIGLLLNVAIVIAVVSGDQSGA